MAGGKAWSFVLKGGNGWPRDGTKVTSGVLFCCSAMVWLAILAAVALTERNLKVDSDTPLPYGGEGSQAKVTGLSGSSVGVSPSVVMQASLKVATTRYVTTVGVIKRY